MQGPEAVLAISIPVLMTVGTFTMVIFIRRYINIERMAIIEKGLNPEHFRGKGTSFGALRAALLLIGGGLGLLMGYWLDRAFYMEEVGYFSMLLIFGGIGLGLAYIIESRKG